jgi:hypothetical protein
VGEPWARITSGGQQNHCRRRCRTRTPSWGIKVVSVPPGVAVGSSDPPVTNHPPWRRERRSRFSIIGEQASTQRLIVPWSTSKPRLGEDAFEIAAAQQIAQMPGDGLHDESHLSTCARASRQRRSGSSWSLRRDRHARVSVNAPLSPKKFTTAVFAPPALPVAPPSPSICIASRRWRSGNP